MRPVLPTPLFVNVVGLVCENPSHSLLFFFSLKVEYDKLANEKTEMQRHYVMVREFCTIFPPPPCGIWTRETLRREQHSGQRGIL